jgi:lipopolysaccharide transport system permease protein
MFLTLFKQRRLLLDLVGRDFLGRYRGSALGILWAVFNPLMLLAVYATVFGVVFKARWPGLPEDKLSFSVLVFSGMIVHGFFAECINRAPDLIVHNANYVKKVIFPLEILPLVLVLSALLHFTLSFLVLVVFCMVSGFSLGFSIGWIPLILLPLILASLGLAWFFSALGVFFRDLTQFVGLLATITLFFAPVFFSPDGLPEEYREYLYWNPITMPVIQVREVMLFDGRVDWIVWWQWLAIGAFTALFGYFWFQKTRKGFADVL